MKMKKKFLLTTLMSIIMYTLLPLNMHAFFEVSNLEGGGTIWCVYFSNGMINSFKYTQILPSETDKVFVVNGKEYSDVLVSTYPAFYDYYVNPDQFLVLHYRAEDSRVYRFDEEKGEDVLMFDYDLSLGDEVVDGDGNKYEVVEVTNVGKLTKYTELNDELKVFKLKGLDDQDREDIWIENVGSVKTGLLRETDYSDVTDSHLLFFSFMSDVPVVSFPLNHDEYKSIPFEKTFPYEDSFYTEEQERYIIEEWIAHEDVQFEFIDDSLHVFGRSYMHRAPFDLIECFINGSTISVGIHQTHGLGNIMANDMTNYGYDVKFPGFNPGTYNIIYYEDNQKKDTTITCLGSVTVIENVQENSFLMHSNDIYDLSGRRLNQVPERGLYIQNGKIRFRLTR